MSNLYSDLDAETLRMLVIRRDEVIVKLKTNPLADSRFKKMIEALWANRDGASMEIVRDYYGESVSDYFDELAERIEDD